MENLEFRNLQKFEFQEVKESSESRICAKVKWPVAKWNKLPLS